MDIFITVIAISIFVALCLATIYIIFLFINSKGFKISPTVASSRKSIKKIADYIKSYNDKNLKQINLKILDIGSGYGHLLFGLNKLLGKNNVFVGYEISKFSYAISKFFNKNDNIFLINDDIQNVQDADFDFVVSFLLSKQQKSLINLYKKFPSGTIILANSNDIPFRPNDGFILIDKIRVHLGWSIFAYKKI
ncbi:MAG: class I SAM-dependent methyltransferase [Rickettsiales bacterium]|jgi:SAM-dependent methyltransferase|nr:class I SAM-dependent methyltransferase [Rickettsiales bacterium]